VPTDYETGGDSACWAHIFEDESGNSDDSGFVTNLVAQAQAATGRGPIWTNTCDDLNVNLLMFRAGEEIEEHVNSELDVLVVGIAGEGVISVDGEPHPLPPGRTMIIPKGARRSTHVMGERFAYLTCHRRRAGLMPTIGKRPAR
jgi:quercetin dioxygenase-like cupin family protein